jgi:hypothetical protein
MPSRGYTTLERTYKTFAPAAVPGELDHQML